MTIQSEGMGVREGSPCNEDCDVCSKSLKKGKHVEIETSGFIVKLCVRCATDVGSCAS